MRIVSLACSNTEIVHALGCAHFLVGVDEHSDWPPEVVGPLPKVGPDLGIDVDAVAARGAAVVEDMRRELNAPAPPHDAPRILVQWWPKPVITPGRRSWATDVLHAAGARGVLESEDAKSRPMTDEEVRERAPDAVVLSWCGVDPAKYRPDVVLDNPAWADLPFVRARHVYPVGEPYLGRPGPRLVEGARRLRRVVSQLTPTAAR